MAFNSFVFLSFLCLTAVLYRILPQKARNIFLLAASYYFYACWNWKFLFLIAISTFIDFIAAAKIDNLGINDEPAMRERKKLWLLFSIITNVSILGFFKYYNFFIDSAGMFLTNLGITAPDLHLNIFLPIGISFYTFKTLSYTIDVYYGKMKSTKSLWDYALYVAFFPELLAGPIDRARSLLPQISAPRKLNYTYFLNGLNLIFRGLFKKVFVADNIAIITNGIFNTANPTSFDILVGAYAFAIQIYADFSGYTDIARGCGKWLGFDLALNFNYPYFSVSPSDFWQKWHISLSTWLRDYIFSPLGGAMQSLSKAYRNLGITMLLAGLWHGASWTFVTWGGYWGLLLIGHRIAQPYMKRWGSPFRKLLSRKVRLVFKIIITFHLVSIGWIIFRAGSLAQAWNMITGLFAIQGAVDWSRMFLLLCFALPLIIIETLQLLSGRDDLVGISWLPTPVKTAIFAVLFYLLAFYGMATQSFIYAQF
jgi:alginate O-acetyltransferase complex protein AlgI